MEVDEAIKSPIKLFQSGPVSGINAAAKVPDIGNQVIATDMGGTSFDVGLVVDGRPLSRKSTIVDHYEYQLATVDIQSIGSGGGSVAWYDEEQGALRVGPHSAGARPGPAAYGRGGTKPTVTDADLLLGYLNPAYFLGGAMELNVKSAEQAMAGLADKMGLSITETAAGVVEIADKQMGDLIRRLTLGKGFDPRDFSLLAYGGAGPVHAAGFAQDVGVREVIIPGTDASSVWSAFGAATSDLVHVVEQGCYFTTPFPISEIQQVVVGIRDRIDQRLGEGTYIVTWTADMHYTTQISELEVILPDLGDSSFGEEAVRRFQELYERTYGRDAGFSEIAVEITAIRARAQQSLGQPRTVPDRAKQSVVKGHRKVYWPALKDYAETPIFSSVSERVEGPLVVELPDTSIVVHPGQSIHADSSGNLVLTLREG
jgi:N-methylhydantoinase A